MKQVNEDVENSCMLFIEMCEENAEVYGRGEMLVHLAAMHQHREENNYLEIADTLLSMGEYEAQERFYHMQTRG